MTMWTRAAAAAAAMLLLPPSRVTAAAEPRFGAVTLDDASGLSPRYFRPASPAIAKRDTTCPADTHPCLDINSDHCCSNTKYCVIDPSTNQAACCEIGVTCGTPCSPASYQCTGTSTPAPGSTSTFAACCGRKCPATSAFLCPSSLGGGCCAYGQTCAPNSACVSTSTSPPPSSKTDTTLVSMLPPGCTTSQIACAPSDGGGCCAAGRVCTVLSSTNYCALATVSPPGNVTAVSDGGGPLSSGGAKAGLGVGVVLAAGLLGAAVFVVVRIRRRRRGPVEGRVGPGGMMIGDGSGEGPPPHRPGMSESTSDVFSRPGGGGGGPLRGIAADYFGPDAVIGPYTDVNAGQPGSSGVSTPGRGVPMEPHGPADIVAPVEIDSVAKEPAVAVLPRAAEPQLQQPRRDVAPAVVPETVEGRFELYGSESVVAQPQSLLAPMGGLAAPPPPIGRATPPPPIGREPGVGANLPTPPSDGPTPLSQQQGVSPLDSAGRSRAPSGALPPPS